jgi:type 1 glutamine amidotransferase
MKSTLCLMLLPLVSVLPVTAEAHPKPTPKFRVIALYENGGHHVAYTKRARVWLDELAAKSNFAIDYIQDTDKIDDDFLSHYQLFIQLDFPPYAWKPKAVSAFESSINQGKIGWIGFHHATLLGEFDGYPMWNWFSHFMGDIVYKNYIPGFARATVNVEDRHHPSMRGIPKSFVVEKEEWYTYDKSPRPNVHVIASVDESTYQPDSKTKMGDHPVVWQNLNFPGRNIYIFMGHDPILFDSKAYTTLFKNSIFWAAGK